MLGELTDEVWEALSEPEREILLADLEAIAGGEGLADFMTRMAPHRPPPPHLQPLIDAFELARVQRDVMVAISMPPGHAKSYLVLHAFAWWLSKFPADLCAYNSYNAPQALGKSAAARVLAEAAGVELSEDSNAKSEWRTTAMGGLVAGGMESLTGKRIQGPLVIDDPYAGPEDANSRAYREKVFDAIQAVALTRLEGGAPIFLIQTRWHPDDAIGRLKRMQKKGEISGWQFINLPALDADGNALWPAMYPADWLNKKRRTIGEFNFSALFQGEPRVKGTRLFGAPHYYDPKTVDFNDCRIGIGADPAASDSETACYSAAVAGRFRGIGDDDRILYLTDVYHEQVTVPQFCDDLRGFQGRNDGAMAAVEGPGPGRAVMDTIWRVDPHARITPSPAKGDKFQRAQGVAAAWNQGRVLVPLGNPPWLEPFLYELESWTGVNDPFSDQVDALAHLWNNGPEISIFDAS